ncbi:uncharacterized protein [Eurosta solidaginis]|uniref:uncharacterized protein n=1 Tax=Eurosta solidaginis TaxID=178769 RepID=UPI003531595D
MVYAKLKNTYNNKTKQAINKYKSESIQMTKLQSNIRFLLKCREAKIIPKFLQNTTKLNYIFTINNHIPKYIRHILDKHIRLFHSKILNTLIKFKHDILKVKTKKLTYTKATLNQNIKEEDLKAFFESEQQLALTRASICKNTQQAKLEKLRSARNNEALENNNNRHWFVNQTKTDFPPDVAALLAKGPKFALPVAKNTFPLFKCIADGEELIQSVKNKEDQESARTKLSLLIKETVTKHKTNTADIAINDTVGRTRKFLNQNKNIVILNADKGNVTVAMEKSDYIVKMNNILSDLSTYRILRQDPTLRLQTKNNQLLDKLEKLGIITKRERSQMTTHTALPLRIYGAPKVHKDNIPLRPICSMINSPSYNLCKYLTNVLKNLTSESKFNVKSAIEFKNKINNSCICDDERLVSFDVVSLFPSVPTDLAIGTIMTKWEDIKQYTDMPKKLFMEILTFCITENRYFKYEEIIYTQLRGLPMGSPASPIVADIIMEEILKKLTNTRLLSKYVDDVFAIIREDELEKTMKTLITYHKDIQFTMELETENRLPFLDCLVCKRGNQIKVDWYQKPTSSGRIMSYKSKHPRSMIKNTAKNFIGKVLDTSDAVFHPENKRKIANILKMNDFPHGIIRRMIKAYSEIKIPKNGEKTTTKYKSMLYIPGFSDRLKGSDIYDKENIKIAHKPGYTTNIFYNNMKSKVALLDKNNIVYKITCAGNENDKCNKEYVGTTKNKLKTRISGHRSDIKCRAASNTQKPALAAHCAESGHQPDFEAVSILQTEQNYKKRFTLEMLHITNTPINKRLNYKIDTDGCSHIYRHLLESWKISSKLHGEPNGRRLAK